MQAYFAKYSHLVPCFPSTFLSDPLLASCAGKDDCPLSVQNEKCRSVDRHFVLFCMAFLPLIYEFDIFISVY